MKELSAQQIDMLAEISNIGAGHAATALSQLLNKKILLQVPSVKVIPIAEVPEVVGGPERLVVGLFFRIFGNAKGNILILFPKESALSLIAELLSREPSGSNILQEMESSALKEVGNILASAYLNALSQMLKMVLIPSVPGLAYDMAGAVLDYILIELSQEGETALLIETEFISESRIKGHFFLLPDPESLRLILSL